MMTSAVAMLALIQAAQAPGPNLLTARPTVWQDPQARAQYTFENGEHRMAITEPGPKPWGVQFFWQLPPTIAKSRLRLSFSHRGTPGMTFHVRVQQAESPYATQGIDKIITTSDEWRPESFDFETPYADRDLHAPIFWLSSSPGSVAFRGIALRHLGAATTVVDPIKTPAHIFAWYERLPSRFKAKDLDGIVGHWGEEYVEHRPYAKEPANIKRDRGAALREFSRQALFETRFSNGPMKILLKSIEVRGEAATVLGFAMGSFRFEDSAGKLIEGGYSWQGDIEDKWVRRDGRWWLVSHTRRQGFLDKSDAELKRLDAAHQALGAKLGATAIP